MTYTVYGKLHPKGVPFLGFRYIKGRDFTVEVYEKVGL